MIWALYQFGRVVEDFCAAADDDLWEAMEDRLALLLERGPSVRMPVSELIKDGVFALRCNVDNRQGRLLYFFGPQRGHITFVHYVLLKKQRRIGRDVIDEAIRRKKLIEGEEATAHAFRIDRTH